MSRPPAAYYADEALTLYHGDALAVLRALPDRSADCCVTSPPYFGLRDYGVAPSSWPAVTFTPVAGLPPLTVPAMDACLGLEPDPWAYAAHIALTMREVRRVLADDGTLWLNIGDSYSTRGGQLAAGRTGKDYGGSYEDVRSRAGERSGLPDKNLIGMPWRVAFALQDDGWVLRKDIIWHKTNAMPESVTDRPSSKKEYLFLLSKGPSYWFDLDAIREPHAEVSIARAAPHRARPGKHYRDGSAAGGIQPAQTLRLDQMNHPAGRNPGDVWSIPTQPFSEAHFAVMPTALAERCIQAGCRPGGTVLDPFSGSGTTGLAAARHGRRYIGADLNAEYLDLSLRTRLAQRGLDFTDAADGVSL